MRVRLVPLLFVASLAACSSESGSGTAVPPVSPVSVRVTGTLNQIGDLAASAATQGSYTGPFTYSSTDGNVLRFTLSLPMNPAHAKASLVSPNGNVFVVAVGPGVASVRVAGTGGAVARPAGLQHVNILAPGGIAVSPAIVGFDATGDAHATTIAVDQAAYAGRFDETDTCAKIASIATLRNSRGSARYSATPIGAGTCNATFTGGNHERSTLAITVTLPGTIAIAPESLHFTQAGSENAQTVTVSQTDYDGSFGESDSCADIATIVATTNAGGSATYRVEPEGAGSCAATFAGGGSQTERLPISVVISGGVALAPRALQFASTGPGSVENVTVSQAGFAGAFTLNDTCAKIATFFARSNSHGVAVYAVTPFGAGSCSATFTGTDAKYSTLPVTVRLSGGVTLDPTSLAFTAAGRRHALAVKVSQENFRAAFTGTDTCAGIATVRAYRNGSGKADYTVTPVGTGQCSATFTGGDAKSATLPILVVVPGPVVVAPAHLTFGRTNPVQAATATVTQSGFAGEFGERDTCANVATLERTSNAGGRAAYLVTPMAAGECTVTFDGANAKRADLSIAVTLPGPVKLAPGSLSFDTRGGSSAVTISQHGYSGRFTEKDDCDAAAQIQAVNTVSYDVTALAAGSCTAVFTGANAESAALPISVVLPDGIDATLEPLNFTAVGASYTVLELITQRGYRGTFGKTDTCAGIASLLETSNANGIATYQITPLAAGTCEAAFTGGNHERFTLHVTVTQTGFGIQ
jgi:hypothetical protein